MISSASTSILNSSSSFNHGEASPFPDWFQEQQANAWDIFLKLPQPTRRDEMWRFSNLKKTSLETFLEASKIKNPDEIRNRSQGITDIAAKMIFCSPGIRKVFGPPAGDVRSSSGNGSRSRRTLYGCKAVKQTFDI